MDENLRASRAHEQHSPPQSVAVPVELLCAHGVEEVIEDSAHVAVHPLQRHVKTQPGRLVHEGLQATDIWREEGGVREENREEERGKPGPRGPSEVESTAAPLYSSRAEEEGDGGVSEGVDWKTEVHE